MTKVLSDLARFGRLAFSSQQPISGCGREDPGDRELQAGVGSKPYIARSSAELVAALARHRSNSIRRRRLTAGRSNLPRSIMVLTISWVWCSSRMARHAGAIEQFKRAISLNPRSGASYFSLAEAYIAIATTPPKKTLRLPRRISKRQSKWSRQVSDFHYSLGVSYWRGAQLERAMASLDRAIELDPGNVKARWARVMLWAPAFSSKGADDSPAPLRICR